MSPAGINPSLLVADETNTRPSEYSDGTSPGSTSCPDRSLSERAEETRRVAQACKRCRVKKMKCDKTLPTCTPCKKGKAICEPEILSKRKRRSPLGPKDLKTLEQRVQYIESCMKKSGMLKRKVVDQATPSEQADPSTVCLGTPSDSTSSDSGGSISDQAQPKRRHDLEQIVSSASPEHPVSNMAFNSDQGANPSASWGAQFPETCVSNVQGLAGGLGGSNSVKTQRHRYWPSQANALPGRVAHLVQPRGFPCQLSNGEPVLSFWSPQGIRWLSPRTNPASLQSMVQAMSAATDASLGEEHHDLLQMSSHSGPYHPLPPKSEVTEFFNAFFDHFNTVTPIYDRETITRLFEQEYEDASPQNPAWFASLNIILAVGMRVSVMLRNNTAPGPWDDTFYAFMKNTTQAMPGILMQPSLLSAQALTAMAMCSQASAAPLPAYSLLAVALRHLHYLGLYEDNQVGPKVADRRQAKTVLWVAFCADKDMTMRSGCPSASIDLDLDLDEAGDDPECQYGLDVPLSDGSSMNILRTRIKLAFIQSRVYQHLYSPWARKRSILDLLSSIIELNQELEEWKDDIPPPVRPPFFLSPPYSSALLHASNLTLQYYTTQAVIHRMAMFCAYNTPNSGEGNDPIARLVETQVRTSAAVCLKAARTSIHLFRSLFFLKGGNSYNWLAMNTNACSFNTIFTYILQFPHLATADSDLDLMSTIVNLVETIRESDGHRSTSATQMLNVCKAMLEMAQKAVNDRRGRQCGLLSVENCFLRESRPPTWTHVGTPDHRPFSVPLNQPTFAPHSPSSFDKIFEFPNSLLDEGLWSTLQTPSRPSLEPLAKKTPDEDDIFCRVDRTTSTPPRYNGSDEGIMRSAGNLIGFECNDVPFSLEGIAPGL